MELLDPRALWLLPLVALLLLLARSQTPRTRRPVANLYLWRRIAQREPARVTVRRLRLHWLIALQAAFMITVIAALARPAWSTAHPHVAFVVDTSASMSARDGTTSRLDVARSRVNALRATLPAADVVRLIGAGPAPADYGDFSPSGAPLGQALDGLSATDGPAAIADAVRVARSRAGADADVYVFTDEAPPPAGVVDQARWIRVGHAADNLAITLLSASRWPARPAGGQVLVEVRNYGSTPHETTVELSQNGVLAGREPLAIPANAARTIALDLPQLGGVIDARLTTDDALARDNRRWTVVPPAAPARVRIVTRGSFFLEHALAADAALAVDVTHSTDPDGAARDNRGADVVICDGCRALPDGRAGVLWIPPADAAHPAHPEALAIANPDHPIARGIEVAGLSGAALARTAAAPAGEVIMRAGTAPAVVAYERSGRRIVEWNLDLATSTMPLDVAFPVLLSHVVDWLSRRNENSTTIVAGEPLDWRLDDLSRGAAVTVTGPDGHARPSSVNDRELVVADTTAAGVYHVRATGADRVFAVNPATATESDLSMPNSQRPSAQASPAGGLATARVEPTAPLLVAALLLVAVEWRQRCRSVR